MLKVLSDILYAMDTGDLSVLTLLDLSAAFDTVGILLQRLKTSFCVSGLVLKWLRSYLTNREPNTHPAKQQGRCGLDYHRDQCWVHSSVSIKYSKLISKFCEDCYAISRLHSSS